MTASDFLVLSSLSEGRPNVILEAHACERATLATDVGGVGELIDQGETGLLVPSQDTQALASGLRQLVTDAGLRDRLGEVARQRLQERGLTWAGTANAMQGIYHRLHEQHSCAA